MAYKVLFVCLGNICRSPTAEGIFRSLLSMRNLESDFFVDSAGTSGAHVGERADKRMREHASKRGYSLESRSRKFVKSDLEKFDLIIVMDDQNLKDVLFDADSKQAKKVKKLTEYCQKIKISHVPDPYYGGDKGFEQVIDIVEDACCGLLEEIIKQKNG